MKLHNARYFVVVIISLVLFITVVSAANNESINALLNRMISVKYNNAEQYMYDATGERVYPISYNGTTYLPIRAICDMLGIDIEWNENSNTVSVWDASMLIEHNVLFDAATMPGGTVDSFYMTIALPEKWHIKNVSDDELSLEQSLYLYNWECDKQYIYNDLDVCVGVIGYNTYTLNEGTNESYKSIYWEVATPMMYNFDIYDKYDVVKIFDYGETALTTVRYSKSFLTTWYPEVNEEKVNSGILSFNRNKSAYIMIELESDLIDEKLIEYIAENVSIHELFDYSHHPDFEISIQEDGCIRLDRYRGSGGSVVIPDGVTEIGNGAFDGVVLRKLGYGIPTSIYIPDTVEKIGNMAFFALADSEGDGLSSIRMSSSINEIGDNAFAECKYLSDVYFDVIPTHNIVIGNKAFAYCENLTKCDFINIKTITWGEDVFTGTQIQQ